MNVHITYWEELWQGGVEMDNKDLAQKVNTTLYYMLSSLNENSIWPTGPGGLATNGYWGNAFWDNDMWSMLSVLPMWPELAKTGITYRYERMGEASKYAIKHNSKGLYFPWQTAVTGKAVDLAALGEQFNVKEKHTGADIVLLSKQYWDATGDYT